MHFSFSDMNIWAVLVAAVISMAIGALWYSPVLFGNIWMRLVQLKKSELRSPAGPMIGAVLMNLIASVLLAVFLQLTGAANAADGLLVGALLSLVVCAKIAINYFFEGKSLQLYLITVGYHVVTYLIAGLLLGAWQ